VHVVEPVHAVEKGTPYLTRMDSPLRALVGLMLTVSGLKKKVTSVSSALIEGEEYLLIRGRLWRLPSEIALKQGFRSSVTGVDRSAPRRSNSQVSR